MLKFYQRMEDLDEGFKLTWTKKAYLINFFGCSHFGKKKTQNGILIEARCDTIKTQGVICCAGEGDTPTHLT